MSAADIQIEEENEKNDADNIPIMTARQNQNSGIRFTGSYSATSSR